MAGLLDLIKKNRAQRFADGGFVAPYAQKLAQGQDALDRAAAVRAGALSTRVPDAPHMADFGVDPNAVSPQETEVSTTGMVPRLLNAGALDVSSGLQNALAATAQALGENGRNSARFRQGAQEASARAEALTPDQTKDLHDVHGVGDALSFAGGHLVRGLPTLAAMGVAGGLARSAGLPALAGVAAPSAAINTGSEYGAAHAAIDDQVARGVITPEKEAELRAQVPAHAFGAGAVNAGLDSLAFGYAAKLTPFAKGLLGETLSQSLPGHVLRSGLVEGASGAAREYVNIAATKHLLENPDMFGLTEADKHELWNAAAQNAAATTPLGVFGHGGHKVGGALDAGIDAYGKVRNMLPGGEPKLGPDGQPVPAGPSLSARAGSWLGDVIDDPKKVVAAGGAAVDYLKTTPLFGRAVQGAEDFLGGLNKSQRVTNVLHWVNKQGEEVQKGYEAFKAAYQPETGNFESAPQRYKELLAHALGAQGMDAQSLGTLSGAKFGAFITGFNAKLPELEKTTGAIFGSIAKHTMAAGEGLVQGAKNFVDEAGKAKTPEWDANPINVDLKAAGAKTGELAGHAARHGIEAADTAYGFAAEHGGAIADGIKGGLDKAVDNFHTRAADRAAAMDKMADAAAPTERPGVKKSELGATLSASAKSLRDAMLDATAKDDADRKVLTNSATKLAKRMDRMQQEDPERFAQFLKDNEEHIVNAFHMTPDEFAHLHDNTAYKLSQTGRDKMAEANVMDKPETAVGHGIDSDEGDYLVRHYLQDRDHEEGSNVGDHESADHTGVRDEEGNLLDERGHPAVNDKGEEVGMGRHPGMSPEMFSKFLSRGDRAGGSGRVEVQRVTKDAKTGEQIGEPQIEPAKVNWINIAKAWASQRETSDTAKKRGGENEQKKFDLNFADGLSAMFGGWQETSKDGKHIVEVSVHPSTIKDGKSVRRETSDVGPIPQLLGKGDIRGWLREESKIGYGKDDYRTFADLQKGNQENYQGQGMAGGVRRYHGELAHQDARLEKAAEKYGRVSEKARAYFDREREIEGNKAAANAVKHAVEELGNQVKDLRENGERGADQAVLAAARRSVENPPVTPRLDALYEKMHSGKIPAITADIIEGRINRAARSGDVADWARGEKMSAKEGEAKRAEIAADPKNKELGAEYADSVLRSVYDEIKPEIDRGVPPAIALLPSEIRHAGRGELLARLSDEEATAQRKGQGEQESSFDNPNRDGSIPDREVFRAGKVPEDATFQPMKDVYERRGGADRNATVDDVPGTRAPREEPQGPPEKATLKRGNEDAPLMIRRQEPDGMRADNYGNKVEPYNTISGKAGFSSQDSAHGNKNDMAGNEVNPGRATKEALVNESKAQREAGKKGFNRELGADHLPPGTKDEALANLRRVLADAKSEEGKASLERAIARVEKSTSLTPADYSALSATKLKPGNLRDIFNKAEPEAPTGEQRDRMLAQERASKKAEPAAAPAEGEVSKSMAGALPGHTLIDSTDPAMQKALVDAVQKITGKKIPVEFDPTLGSATDPDKAHQAEYDVARKVVRLAATTGFGLSNAAHEAFHAVFQNYLAAEDKTILWKAFREGGVQHQMKKLLEASPEAWDSARRKPEEMMAYGFQMWRSGLLKVGPNTNTIFGKIHDMLQKVNAWLRDQPTAKQMLEQIASGYFADGKPSPAEIALANSNRTWPRAREVTKSVFEGIDKLYDTVLTPYDDRIRGFGNAHADVIAKQLYQQVGEHGEQRGFAQEVPLQMNRRLNALDKLAKDPSGNYDKTLQEMATGVTPTDTAMAGKIREHLNALHQYAHDAGVKMGYTPDYLPMVWDGQKIGNNRAAFVAMLEGHQAELDSLNKRLQQEAGNNPNFKDLTPESIADMMAKRGTPTGEFIGGTFDENGAPRADFTLNRVFDFLNNADRAPFVKDNLAAGMTRYTQQIVHRAEWARRFGDDNAGWNNRIAAAKRAGLTAEQEQLIRDYKDDAFGKRLHDMNPTVRKVLEYNTVYQNVRVLGLAVLGNLIDPMGIAVRSGDWGEAFNAYKTAAQRMFKGGREQHQDMQEMGEMIGAVERAGVADMIQQRYGGVEVHGAAREFNTAVFKYNGMEGLTRSVRIAALAAGTRFIKRNAGLVGKGGDPRHLEELGLKASDVQLRPDGTLKVLTDHGLDPATADRVQNALNRFVDEAAMRPNIGERTRWGANPYLAWLYHLKQYTFSFNKVINKKLEHEFIEHGNPTPYMMAATYIPIMAGTAMLRDLITHAGELPAQNGFLHYMGSGVARSGLMGPSDLAELGVGGVATGNINSVRQALGPTADQFMDAFGAISTAGGAKTFGHFVKESVPGGSIIQHF